MNANRKADLQRKLALAPLPKPPAGLAERIKSDIPKPLRFNVEEERERLSKSIAFNIRVAASILILISCAYLALHLLTRIDEQKQPAATPAARRAPALRRVTELAPPAAQAQPPAPPPTPARLAKRKAKPQAIAAEAKEERARETEVAAAPAVTLAPPPAAPAAEPQVVAAKARTVAALSSFEMRDQSNVATSVDQFTRPDAFPAHDVRLESEIAIEPFRGNAVLRVSVDAGINISAVKLQIEGARPMLGRTAGMLAANSSVTSLYEIEATTATIRLRYRDDGVEKAVDRTVTRAEVRPWSAASRRTKAAILTAEWARGGDVRAIARAAREAGLDDLADAVEKSARR